MKSKKSVDKEIMCFVLFCFQNLLWLHASSYAYISKIAIYFTLLFVLYQQINKVWNRFLQSEKMIESSNEGCLTLEIKKSIPILQQKVDQLKIFTVPIKNELTKTGGLLIEAFITLCSISFKCKFQILSLSQ